MDWEQTEKQRMPLVFDADLRVDAWSLQKDPKLLKKTQIWHVEICKQQHARPSWGTVSLYWDMGQRSWDWVTCSNLDRLPSEPHWPSVCPSCAEALCSREERATSAGHCFFKYSCWTSIITISHLRGAARFSASLGLGVLSASSSYNSSSLCVFLWEI